MSSKNKKIKPYVTLINSGESHTVFLEYKAKKTINQILRSELEENLKKKAKIYNGIFIGSDVDYLNQMKIIWFDFKNPSLKKVEGFLKSLRKRS